MKTCKLLKNHDALLKKDLELHGNAYEYTNQAGTTLLLDPTRIKIHTRKPSAPQCRFEYTTEYLTPEGDDLGKLQKLGQEGWELCVSHGYRYLLKRRLP